ncbi:MAG: hypothetical protein ACR2QC_06970, partial [Gammaproteobacteria bacterium]
MGIIGDIFGGGDSSETVVQQPNLTPEQIELINRQIELADIQIEELGRQRRLQRQVFDPATAGAERLEASIGQTPFDFSQITTSQPGGLPQAEIIPPGAITPATPSPLIDITPPVQPGQPQLPGAPTPGTIPGVVGAGRQLATEDVSDQLIAQQLERL